MMMMISIARKNLPSLLLKNPNSNVHLFLSINCFFSTSRAKKSILNPEIYDLLFQKHHFSSEFASSLASAHLTKFATPERADAVLSSLKENSFTNAQLERIVRYKPLILGYDVEDLLLKLKIFRDLGLSSEEIAKMMSSNQMVLYISTKNNILPKLSILKALLGSDQDVARLVTKCSSWIMTSNLDKTLIPNVEILKSSGIPMERVLHFLHIDPRCLLIKPDIMKKSVDKAIEFGVPQASTSFIHAVSVFAYTTQEMLEAKLQTLRDLGFSDVEILTMFRSQPNVFSQSHSKLKSAVELLVGIGKYSISDIVARPSALGHSIKKRLEPRLQILGLLASKNLIKQWPAISVLQYKDDKFFDKFVNPYYDEIGEESITKRFCRGQSNSSSEEEEEEDSSKFKV